MTFCKNCGQQISDNVSFCPACGTPVTEQTPNYNTGAPNNGAPNNGAPYNGAPNNGNNYYAPPVQPQIMNTDADVQANKSIAWLSYLGILFLIPMFTRKNSPFCQFHVKQGATLFACSIAYTIATEIIKAIIKAIFPGHLVTTYFGTYYTPSVVSNIFSVIFSLGSIAIFVLAIIGIVNSASGKVKELPIIGKIPFIADLLDKYFSKQ